MKCDIIIPIWNQKDITKGCIDSITRNTGYPYRLILIDNGSDDATKSYLESVRNSRPSDVVLIRNEKNLGFVKAVNQGLKTSTAPYVCISNNDTIATPGWLEELVEFSRNHSDVGIMNPLCGGPSHIPMDEYAKIVARDNKGKYMEMNQCFLFCALIKREVIEKIGFLDEVFGMGCFDDTDYSMRAGLAGYRCVCVHSSYVHHISEVSFNAMGNRKRIVAQCEKEFFKKWPRHLRAGVIFSLNKNKRDEEIANMLKGVLYLARNWSWIKLWIFADRNEDMKRIETVSGKIGMPLHQNIKFDMLPAGHKYIQVLIRLLERSFGNKRKKRYDFIITDDSKAPYFFKLLGFLHKTKVRSVDFTKDVVNDFKGVIKESRKNR